MFFDFFTLYISWDMGLSFIFIDRIHTFSHAWLITLYTLECRLASVYRKSPVIEGIHSEGHALRPLQLLSNL